MKLEDVFILTPKESENLRNTLTFGYQMKSMVSDILEKNQKKEE